MNRIDFHEIITGFLRRGVRFSLTGLFVTGVHFLLAATFINYILVPPPFANGLAFSLATITSFFINTLWSFSTPLHGRTLFRFIAVSFVGFLLAILVSWIVQQLGFWYLYGIFTVVLVVTPTNFLLHNFWTYK